MQVENTEIHEVLLLKPEVFKDKRGFFMEVWNKNTFKELGINYGFVQDNHSYSIKNTLRGIHYQIKKPQGKLVRVTQGEVFDVAVDLRRNSPTFGKWVGRNLSAENKFMLWIPPRFGHGFFVLSKTANLQYKCTDYYDPLSDQCILWQDQTIKILWPIPAGTKPILSEKDALGKQFKNATHFD